MDQVLYNSTLPYQQYLLKINWSHVYRYFQINFHIWDSCTGWCASHFFASLFWPNNSLVDRVVPTIALHWWFDLPGEHWLVRCYLHFDFHYPLRHGDTAGVGVLSNTSSLTGKLLWLKSLRTVLSFTSMFHGDVSYLCLICPSIAYCLFDNSYYVPFLTTHPSLPTCIYTLVAIVCIAAAVFCWSQIKKPL